MSNTSKDEANTSSPDKPVLRPLIPFYNANGDENSEGLTLASGGAAGLTANNATSDASLNEHSTIPYSELLTKPKDIIEEVLSGGKSSRRNNSPTPGTKQGGGGGSGHAGDTTSGGSSSQPQGSSKSKSKTRTSTPNQPHRGAAGGGSGSNASSKLFASLTMASAPDASLVPTPMFLFAGMPKRILDSAKRANAEKLQRLSEIEASGVTSLGGGSVNSPAHPSHPSQHSQTPGRSKSTPKSRPSAGASQPVSATQLFTPTSSNKQSSKRSTETPSSPTPGSTVKTSASNSLSMLASILPPSAIVTTAPPLQPAAQQFGSAGVYGAPATAVTQSAPSSAVATLFGGSTAPVFSSNSPSQATPTTSVAGFISPESQNPPTSVASALAAIVPALSNQFRGVTSPPVAGTPPQVTPETTPGQSVAAPAGTSVPEAPAAAPPPATSSVDRMQMLLNRHKRK